MAETARALFYEIAMSRLMVVVIAKPGADYLKALDRLPPETRVIVSDDRQLLRQAAPGADIILNAALHDPKLLADTFPHASRVRWVHSMWAGVENHLTAEMVRSPVPLTNGRGAFRRALGEWVVAAMLYFSYRLRRLVQQQEAGRWERFEVDELYGHTLGIVGYGEIGRAVAERARPFGMRILALRRRPELSADDPLVDRVFPPARVDEMLADCDYVALTAPLTAETRGMIGAAQFAVMKASAVIVNVGRGAVIDEAPLLAALESGKLRGAALDVFATEPLPAGHPFYRLENVLVSPHGADLTPGWADRAAECFLDNFARFSRGEPLENLVDKHAGY